MLSEINNGKIKVFTIDSIDNEAWTNFNAHPYDRGIRHSQYDAYFVNEFTPFVRRHCNSDDVKLIANGASMGGYHATNFFFKYPNIFDTLISLSGVCDLRLFIGDYVDDNVYFNSPLLFLKNLYDPTYLNAYRESKIIICVGQGAWEDEMLEDAHALQRILEDKNIPAWFDYWGKDVNHDWPWWKIQLPYFLGKLNL